MNTENTAEYGCRYAISDECDGTAYADGDACYDHGGHTREQIAAHDTDEVCAICD